MLLVFLTFYSCYTSCSHHCKCSCGEEWAHSLTCCWQLISRFLHLSFSCRCFRSCVSWRHYFTDRKSTRLNSSHANISYAVFCLKKKKKHINTHIKLIITY